MKRRPFAKTFKEVQLDDIVRRGTGEKFTVDRKRVVTDEMVLENRDGLAGDIRLCERTGNIFIDGNPDEFIGLLFRPYLPGYTELDMRRLFWTKMRRLHALYAGTKSGTEADAKELAVAEDEMEEAWDAYRLGKPLDEPVVIESAGEKK